MAGSTAAVHLQTRNSDGGGWGALMREQDEGQLGVDCILKREARS